MTNSRRGLACYIVPLAFAALSMCPAASPSARAGEVKTWRQDNAEDFQKGQLKRLVVNSEGQVRLSRQLKALADLKVAHVWALVNDAAGNLYAATGGPGQVVQVDPAGKTTVLHSAEKEQIFALAIASDGTLYAGLSPSGKILKGKAGAPFAEFYATSQTYVWGLEIDNGGNLFAATGTPGKLHRITPQGQGKVVFEATQPHLLSLAVSPSGVIYTGSSQEGIIYQIAPGGRPYVLFDADQADVHELIVADDGTVYAGTGSPERPKLPELKGSGSSSDMADDSSMSFDHDDVAAKKDDAKPAADKKESKGPDAKEPSLDKPKLTDVASSSSSSDSSSSDEESEKDEKPASTGVKKASPGENAVYRIRTSGAVDEVFREKALVLSLALQGGKLLIGTGQEGRLYEWNPADNVRSEIARLEHGQVSAMTKKADGSVILGTGVPGKLYLLENRFASNGTLVSDVLDAKVQAKWGAAALQSDLPKGSELEVSFRTGNIAKPDTTWSDWTVDSRKLPIGRFLQYQALLRGPDGTVSPTLSAVTLYYATLNRAPKVESIKVPDLEKSPVTTPQSKVKLEWKGTDQNSDALRYQISIRKDEWPEWITVAKEISKSEYSWDPGSMPSGVYRVRVTATDLPSNRAEEALTGTRVSSPFVLDREAPNVKFLSTKVVDKKVEVQVNGVDAMTRIASADYSTDGKKWHSLFPDDGLFDSKAETITFLSGELETGPHVLIVRFVDSAGQTGVADTLVTIP